MERTNRGVVVVAGPLSLCVKSVYRSSDYYNSTTCWIGFFLLLVRIIIPLVASIVEREAYGLRRVGLSLSLFLSLALERGTNPP